MGPLVLFVHGANHDGWCWAPVLERLDRCGVPARALDLPLTSFADDTEAVRAAISHAARPVLLVAHSYGGLPVAAGGHEARRLMFVAARMPAPGESPAGITPHWGHPEFRQAWTVREDGAVNLTAQAANVLYTGSPPNLTALAMARWRWTYSGVPQQPINDPAWQKVPSCYVVCTQDRTVQVRAQRECARRADEWVELDCDHAPFFSAPDALVKILGRQVTAATDAVRAD